MAAKKNPPVYQIHISLRDSKPPIWRRVLVPSNMLLPDLHKLIQAVMGWENSHLHQFYDGQDFYGPPSDFGMDETINYNKIKLSDMIQEEKDRLMYEYDFGDGWIHIIKLEKILPYDEKLGLPVCIKGKLNCPPEDCGGIWGYEDIKEALKNPKKKENQELLEWVGEDFDPTHFDIEEVNAKLKQKDFGVFSIF